MSRRGLAPHPLLLLLGLLALVFPFSQRAPVILSALPAVFDPRFGAVEAFRAPAGGRGRRALDAAGVLRVERLRRAGRRRRQGRPRARRRPGHGRLVVRPTPPATLGSALLVDKYGRQTPLVPSDGAYRLTLEPATANTVNGDPTTYLIGGNPVLVVEP